MKDNNKRELLFSVTASDCDWSYTRGSGKGGQKKNKTSSAVHCKHRASGAHGYAEDDRSQVKNKRLAFTRMATTPTFLAWHKLEVARRLGQLAVIEEKIDKSMNSIKVEIKKQGIWTEIDKNQVLPDEMEPN